MEIMSNSDEEKKYHKKYSEDADRRCRIAGVFIAFFAAVSIILLSVVIYLLMTKRYYNSLCLTKDCTLTASTFIGAMDQSIDPCKNFYQFACADFIRKNPISDDTLSINTFGEYQETFNLQLKNLIESHNAYNDTDVVFRLQESYHVCLNTSEETEKEFEAFKYLIETIYDGWPLAQGSKWKTKYVDITDYLAQILRNDELDFMLIEENYTSKQYMFNLRPIFLGDLASFEDDEVDSEARNNETAAEKRERERYEKKAEKERKAARKLLSKILHLFGKADETDIDLGLKKMNELVAFMKKEFRIEEEPNITEMTIREMNEKSDDEINWLKIFKAKYPEKEKSFTLKTKVSVLNEESLNAIPKIIDKFPRSVLVNAVLGGRISTDFLEASGNPTIIKLYNEFVAETEENYHPPLRWQFCIGKMMSNFDFVITRLFINKYVDKKSKRIVDEMIQLIQQAYKQRILQSEWLDQPTKDRAVKKAEGIRRFVAYPDGIFNNAKLESRYSHLSRVNSTWFWESINLQRGLHHLWKETTIASQTGANVDEIFLWDFNPLMINAFYDLFNNSIWFPSGILQLPFFHENRLAAVNFGMIGAVIGHEIGHAFDDTGSQYNEKGEVENWWTNSAKTTFEKKSECFVNQYNKFCPEELQGGKDDDSICVNGEETLGENLADFTGLNAAFDAYKLWVKKYGEEPRLPSLEKYTPEQLFFIAFGYLWCEVIMPDKWVDRFKYDVHPPGKYRNEGSLSNSQYFREAFKCAKGRMNRGSDSCSLW